MTYAPKPPLWRGARPSKWQTIWLVVAVTAVGSYFALAIFESPFLTSPAEPAAVEIVAIDNVAHADDGGRAQIRYQVALPDGSAARMHTPSVHRVGDRLPAVLMRGLVTGRAFVTTDLPMLTPITTIVRAICPGAGTDSYFFPETALEPGPDEFRRRWYSKHLTAMTEPSLSCGPLDTTESYRFVWLRTFDPPIAVRGSWIEGHGELVAVVLDGAGGYDPGNPGKRLRRKLARDEWDALRAAVDRSHFWTSPTAQETDETGLDGAQWIVEGRRNGRHHVVDRWSPDAGNHRELGLAFVRAAGLEVLPDDVY